MNAAPLWNRVAEAWGNSTSVRGAALGVWAALVLLCSAALWLGSPWRELRSGEREYAQKMRAVETLQQRIAAREAQTAGDSEELATRSRRWMGRLPATPQIAAFSDDLERAAQQSGVRLQSVNPGRMAREDFYAAVPLQLEVEGGYEALRDFLESLTQLPRALRVSDVELQALRDGAELRAFMLLQLYCCAASQETVQSPAPQGRSADGNARTAARQKTDDGAGQTQATQADAQSATQIPAPGRGADGDAHTTAQRQKTAGDATPTQAAAQSSTQAPASKRDADGDARATARQKTDGGAMQSQATTQATQRGSPFQPSPAARDAAAQTGMEPVGSIRRGARLWRLLRDRQGRVHRIEGGARP